MFFRQLFDPESSTYTYLLAASIVETTLRPILERLGSAVTPAQILDLKVCDPAMGSGAFLVEACRQLADHLVAAWRRTGTMPEPGVSRHEQSPDSLRAGRGGRARGPLPRAPGGLLVRGDRRRRLRYARAR